MEPDPSDFNLDFTQHNPAICLTNSAGFYRNATSPKVPGNFQGISSWNMIVSSTSVCFMLGMSPKFCPTKAPFTIEHSQLIHRALKTENWLIDFLYSVYIYIYIITYHCILVSLPFKKMMILFNSAPRLQECVFAHLSLYHHHFGFYVTRRQMFLKTPDSKVSLLYCWKKSHAREYVHVQIKDIVRLTSTK